MVRASLDDVMSTVESLLIGVLDSTQMPDAVDRVRRLFDGSKACLARLGPGLRDDDAIATNSDPEMQRRCYEDLLDDFAFMIEGVSRVPVGEVYADTELFDQGTLRGSRVWRDWMEPQDMYGGLGCRVLDAEPSFWFFDVQRGRNQEPFGSAEKELLAKLAPLLGRIANVKQHIGRLTLERDTARHALDALAIGIIVTDARLRLIHANGMAEELLAEPDGSLSGRSGKLFARGPADHAELRRLVAEAVDPLAATGACGHLLARAGGPLGHAVSLSVTALPTPAAYGFPGAGPCALIAIRSLEPAASLAASAQRLFALTETEARVAAALAAGRSLQETAKEQNVRISTARTHLARILQKTGTRQQSQMVALLRGTEMPLRAAPAADRPPI